MNAVNMEKCKSCEDIEKEIKNINDKNDFSKYQKIINSTNEIICPSCWSPHIIKRDKF